MDPPRGNDQSLVLLQFELVALVDHVAEEDLALVVEPLPPLEQGKVLGGRGDEVERLGAPRDVVPDGRAAKVDVKVGEGVLHAQDAVLPHLGQGLGRGVLDGLPLVAADERRRADPAPRASSFAIISRDKSLPATWVSLRITLPMR